MIAFTVPSIPVAQPRQRHAVRQFGGKAVAVNYTPTKHPVTDFKATVRLAFAQVHQGAPLQGPVRMRVTFVFPRPESKRWKTREMPRYEHTNRPDLDNVIKSLKDALSELAWNDDAQVFSIEAHKWIAAGDEPPHVYVELEDVSHEHR